MGLFPKIQGHCPYTDRLDELITQGHCNMCNREVFDLTAMTEDERITLVCDRKGDVCVRYNLMVPVIAAALAASSGAAMAKDVAHPNLHKTVRGKAQKPAPIYISMPTAGIVAPPPPSHPAAGTEPAPAAAQDQKVTWIEQPSGAAPKP